jgi:type II secretion system protein C
VDWNRISAIINIPRGTLDKVAMWAQRLGLLLALSYVGASSVSAWLASTMLGSALQAFNRPHDKAVAAAAVNYNPNYNYHPLLKTIKDRNLFNSEGKYPEESNPDAKPQEESKSSFDINAACTKPTINVELVGTIFTGSAGSLATLQEQGYSEADVYKEGDLIIGNEDAAIVQIERNRVILNNKGKKECLELASSNKGKKDDGFPSAPASAAGGMAAAEAAGNAPAGGGDCSFDEKYVQSELGSGFGTIIQKARLVPNTTDNVMNGFKIFAIDSASLLGKTGLQNGDIITQVNETSLKQPEQGFALYQALQDEKEVRIHILRRGTTPMTIVCRIK